MAPEQREVPAYHVQAERRSSFAEAVRTLPVHHRWLGGSPIRAALTP